MTPVTRLTPIGVPGIRCRFTPKAANVPRRITTLRPFGVPGAWYGDVRAERMFTTEARSFAVVGEDRRHAVQSEDRKLAINEGV